MVFHFTTRTCNLHLEHNTKTITVYNVVRHMSKCKEWDKNVVFSRNVREKNLIALFKANIYR